MPARITCNGSGSNCSVSTPNMVHAKSTSRAKAMKQARLLNAIEHGYKPKSKRSRVSPTGR